MLQIKWTPREGSPPQDLWKVWFYSGIFCTGMGVGVLWTGYRPEVASSLAPWLIGFGIIGAVIASIMSARRRAQGG
jgi:hypothetical protein